MTAGDWQNGTNLTSGILGQGQLGLTATNLLATSPVPAATFIKVTKVVLSNVTASPVTVTYGAVKAGGTLVDATSTAKGWALGAAGSTTDHIDVTEWAGLTLGPGDFLAALAGTATAVTYTVSGYTRS